MSAAPSPEATEFDDTIHATCVAADGRALLLCGPSGAGKSDLALRLIDRGARLVSDDRTRLVRRGDHVVASAPQSIAGLIEVRGLGILPMPHLAEAPLALILDLTNGTDAPPERYPMERTHRTLCGLPVPQLRLAPFEAGAAIKAELALRHFGLPFRRLETA